MGDRIAILAEGGVLAQYATPDEILARPADEFVERFVGRDRGIKRLALWRVDEVELEPAPANGFDGPRVANSTTLRDALSLMLSAGSTHAVVHADDGADVGVLSIDHVTELLRTEVPA